MNNKIEEYFISLVTIDSESKNELGVARKLQADLEELGAIVSFDNAQEKTGGNCGNLYAFVDGNIEKEPILFCAHMDTVQPGNGVKPSIINGKIITDGMTVLGADDKSGIAEIVWALKELKAQKIEHAPIEILFTVCEEIGLLGAKYADYSRLKSSIGFALDSHQVGGLTIGAPSQNSMKYTIHGLEAHAGVEPEKGISAIQIAGEAISKMELGRIDYETTCNLGTIQGGKASNIVPNEVQIKAEVRSHNQEKLDLITNKMTNIFQETTQKYKLENFQAKVIAKVVNEYHSFKLEETDEPIQLAKKASQSLGIHHVCNIGGGGSDANIFNSKGRKIAIAGTGMKGYHTVNESIYIEDLIKGSAWILEVIKEYSK
jgi:tripeptide aminopeptidase